MLPIRSTEEAKAAWESGDEGELGDRDVAFAFPDRTLVALNRIISGAEAGGGAQKRKCRICLSSTWRADPAAKVCVSCLADAISFKALRVLTPSLVCVASLFLPYLKAAHLG